ncbi:hypothetical protein [uncultured Parasutterella sp.]|uniref:hypothetical protein n=1 Tax=uncultured Parasutterella sp. TaxID=1263098 RepID=UPI0025B3BBC0|nr:hypothetical protein [uncultured Parasutterella sp.]
MKEPLKPNPEDESLAHKDLYKRLNKQSMQNLIDRLDGLKLMTLRSPARPPLKETVIQRRSALLWADDFPCFKEKIKDG